MIGIKKRNEMISGERLKAIDSPDNRSFVFFSSFIPCDNNFIDWKYDRFLQEIIFNQ